MTRCRHAGWCARGGLLALALASACRTAPAPGVSSSPAVVGVGDPAGVQPLALPVYPGAVEAGVTEGPGKLVQTFTTPDGVETVRGFFTPPHLPGFEVSIDAGTVDQPRRIRDLAGHRDYSVAVSDRGQGTAIEITTTIAP